MCHAFHDAKSEVDTKAATFGNSSLPGSLSSPMSSVTTVCLIVNASILATLDVATFLRSSRKFDCSHVFCFDASSVTTLPEAGLSSIDSGAILIVMYAASFEAPSMVGNPTSLISALLNCRRATSARLASSVETQNVLRGNCPASVPASSRRGLSTAARS